MLQAVPECGVEEEIVGEGTYSDTFDLPLDQSTAFRENGRTTRVVGVITRKRAAPCEIIDASLNLVEESLPIAALLQPRIAMAGNFGYIIITPFL